MLPQSFSLALLIRSISLIFPHTFFQPDEFYQAFEPAHQRVFGYGHLTWEWKDLPYVSDGSWWACHISGGRMRGWLWPGIFAILYQTLRVVRQDNTVLLTFAPRLVGVLVAATTDYATSLLATRLLGDGSASGALFLSLTSLFNAHLLPRALSTSPETLLTTLSLLFYPFPDSTSDGPCNVEQQPNVGQPQSKRIAGRETQNDKELDYIKMDRMAPRAHQPQHVRAKFRLFVCLAALTLCLRPTTLPLWIFLATELCCETFRDKGIRAMLVIVGEGLSLVVLVFSLSTTVDYLFTGRLVIPALTFFHQNVMRNVSSFYGVTNVAYHLVQSLPIMLFPVWWWWGEGFLANLLPDKILPSGLAMVDRPQGMRILARALAFTIATLSLSPHSEWRFLHPLLPALLIFVLPSTSKQFQPTMSGCYRLGAAIRQYVRFGKRSFYLCLLCPLLPWIYLNAFHGKAQVEVMRVLRDGHLGAVSSLVILAPCHAMPWMSHLHANIPGWFLTCEPPLEDTMFDHVTSQTLFYDRPVTYIQTVFPNPPVPLHQIPKHCMMFEQPSHVVLFGDLLKMSEKQSDGAFVTVGEALSEKGYTESWYGWNGFDLAQDEMERRGGVRVWTLRAA